MKFYKIDGLVGRSLSPYCGTLSDAHEDAKKHAPEPVYRKDVLIQEVEVATDKDGVLKLLNEHAPLIRNVGRTWGLTARGGLNEIIVDATPAEGQ